MGRVTVRGNAVVLTCELQGVLLFHFDCKQRLTFNFFKTFCRRTFAVTCLSEDTGILEWVPNTSSLRNLVSDAYNPQAAPLSSKRRGLRMTNPGDPILRNNYEKKCQEMYVLDK